MAEQQNNTELKTKEIKIPVQKTVILNSSDRFYQDVVITYQEPTYNVFALVNERINGNYYELWPNVLTMPYKTKQEADIVYDGITGIMDYQKTQVAYQNIRKWIADDIAKFRQDIAKMGHTIVR